MLSFFIVGICATAALCLGLYVLLQRRVLDEQMMMDDAKGYLLIGCVLFSFAVSATSFYVGQLAGFDQSDETATLMALAILIDVMTGLLSLIFGLQRMHEPEHY